MEPTFFAQYKGFEFHCSPTRLHGGGFIPRLLISADYGASEIDIPVPVQGPPYLDATEAAHRSFWQGRRWVDTGGHTAFTGPAAALAHTSAGESD